MARKYTFCTAFFLLCLLSACQLSPNYAPIVDRKAAADTRPNMHTVVRGETLYSIAWLYGMDFRRLAATNAIAAPFTIFPGQVLQLRGGQEVLGGSSAVSAQPSGTAHGTNKKAIVPKVETVPSRRATVSVNSADDEKLRDKNRYPFRWQWPLRGRLLKAYEASSSTHKGIDIQGILGEPVHAANSGRVVYAGSGLVGYGNLLIIKHDEHFLSAYGHNRKLLAKEGDLVKVGQPIAEVGSTGSDELKLHFEIRRDGKPVNPLTLLPPG